MQELEDNFKKNGGSFKEFKIGDLFNIRSSKKKFNANSITFNGKNPYIARGSSNNGIRGYIDEDVRYLNPGKTISLGQDTATLFYQEKPYFTGDKIKIVEFKDGELDENVALYSIAAIKKTLSTFQWGQTSFDENILENIKFSLPIQNDRLAFDYMQDYVKWLEHGYIRELDSYLKVTGLDNYELTDEEKGCLNKKAEFKPFKIGDLFDIKGNPQLDKESFTFSKQSEYPYFTRTVFNNGIYGYVDYLDSSHLINGNSIAVGMLACQFFFMKHDFYAGQFTKTLFLRKDKGNLTENVSLYFCSYLNHFSNYLKGYLVRDFERLVSGIDILLPIQNNQIDFHYMETYIRAIEKLIIKGVVDWKNKIIKTTKKIVTEQ